VQAYHRTLLKLAVAQEMANANARFEIKLVNSSSGGLEDVRTEVVPICSRQMEILVIKLKAIMSLAKRFVGINANWRNR